MHHVYLEIMKKIWKTVNARFLVYRNNGKIGRVSRRGRMDNVDILLRVSKNKNNRPCP